MHNLFPLLRSDNISVKNKLLIYKVIIRPIMFYACPIWGGVAAKTYIDMHQIVQNKCLSLALHARRRTRIVDLHKRTNIEHIDVKISNVSKLFYEKLKTDDSVHLPDLPNVPFRIKHKFTY